MAVLRARPIYTAPTQLGISVGESHHAPDFFMDWIESVALVILYVVNGEGQVQTRKNRYALKKGHLIVIQRKQAYRVVDAPGRPLSLLLLGVHNPQLESLWRESNGDTVRHISHRATCQWVQKLLKDLLFEWAMTRSGKEFALMAATLEIMLALLRRGIAQQEPETFGKSSSANSRARITAYVRSLDENFYRPQSLDEAASGAGLQVRRFQGLFQEIAGESWLRYIRRKRINHAKLLLQKTSRSIMAVCFECGFDDLSTFYRSFQKLERTSPDAWRRAHVPRQSRQQHA